MTLDTRKIINSRYGVGLAAFLARQAPPWLGFHLANLAANFLSSRENWSMVQAARANQWVASGETLTQTELDAIVRENFRNTARAIYEVNHFYGKPGEINRLIDDEQIQESLYQRPKNAARGLVIAGIHQGNFDLTVMSVILKGLVGLLLGLPEIKGGYQIQHEMRKRTGMDLVPTSPSSLRKAVEYLRTGGIVATGLDRPIPEPPIRPVFFGRQADLPVHHIYLALKAQVPVMVTASPRQSDGRYHILASEPIEMEHYPDRAVELKVNAEKVCRVAENFIRMAPAQWSMTFPVWPEAIGQVPKK
jgi:lauroyl/myristoyl acyltransferase